MTTMRKAATKMGMSFFAVMLMLLFSIATAHAAVPTSTLNFYAYFEDDHNNVMGTRATFAVEILRNGEVYSNKNLYYSSNTGISSGTTEKLPLYDEATGESYDYEVRLKSVPKGYELRQQEFDAATNTWKYYLRWTGKTDYTASIVFEHWDAASALTDITDISVSLRLEDDLYNSTWSHQVGAPDTIEYDGDGVWTATWKDLMIAHPDVDATKGEWSQYDDTIRYRLTLENTNLVPWYSANAYKYATGNTFAFSQNGYKTLSWRLRMENSVANTTHVDAPFKDWLDLSAYSIWVADKDGNEIEGTRHTLGITSTSSNTSYATYSWEFPGYDENGEYTNIGLYKIVTDFNTNNLPPYWTKVRNYSGDDQHVVLGRMTISNPRSFVTWEDNNDILGLRPTSFDYRFKLDELYQNRPGAEYIHAAEFSWNKNTYYSEKSAGFPLYDTDGNELDYLMEVDAPPCYTVDVVNTSDVRSNGREDTSLYDDYRNKAYTVTLSLPTRKVTANVTFENETDEGKNRPSLVAFVIKYADGTEVPFKNSTQTASAGSGWAVEWDVPLYDANGNLAEYKVEPVTLLPLHALTQDSPVKTSVIDEETGDTVENYAFTYVEQENWNYAIDLIWDESDPALWYEQYEIVHYNNAARNMKYKLTIRVNAAHYDTGKLEVRLPYYMLGIASTGADAYHAPSAVGVPASPQYNASNPFNYYIDDHDTDDKHDDEIVFVNWTPITDSINQTIEVMYTVHPSQMRDTQIVSFQATGNGVATYQDASGNLLEQPAEQKTTPVITYGIDNGISSSFYIDSAKIYYDGRINLANGSSVTPDDYDEYIYVRYDLYYSIYMNQYNKNNIRIELPEGAEIVSFAPRYGFAKDTDVENSWTYAGLHYPYLTSNQNTYSTMPMLVKLPRTRAGEDDEQYDVWIKAIHTTTAMHPHENDKVEGLDFNDVDVDEVTHTLTWTPKVYTPSGDIYSADKSGYSLPEHGLEYIRSNADIDTAYFYAYTYVQGSRLGRPFQIITDDDAMFARMTDADGAVSEWVQLTEKDYFFDDAQVYVSWAEVDQTTGEATYDNMPKGEFILQGQKAYGGQWEDIQRFELQETSQTYQYFYADEALFAGKNYTGLRVVSPQGMVGNISIRLYVYPTFYADSPLFQQYVANGATKIEIDNYSAHYIYDLDPDSGEYEWFNAYSLPYNVTNAVVNGLNEKDLARLNAYVMRDNVVLNMGLIRKSSYITKTKVKTVNDTVNSKVDVTFQVKAYEGHRYANTIPNYFDERAWQEGVFYDLLPPGYTLNEAAGIKVTGHYTSLPCSLVKVETVDNYKDSGRQLARFYVQYDGEEGTNWSRLNNNGYDGPEFNIEYTASISWTEWSYAPSGYNLVAFQEGHGDEGKPIYNARDDDGSFFNKLEYGANMQEIMSDLNGDGKTDGGNTLCSSLYFSVDVVGAYATGVNKLVKANSGYYRLHDVADLSGGYSYKISFTASDGGTTKDLVLFDILEEAANTGTTNGVANSGEIWWKGTLAGVDVGLPSRQGIQPRVFYTTSEITYGSIDKALNDDKKPVLEYLNDQAIWQEWTQEAPPADMASVTALAFDLTKDVSGSPYVFEGSSATYVEIFMQAPSVLPEAVLAYNRPSYYTTFTTGAQHSGGTSTHNINDRVTVELRDLKDFSFIKMGEYELIDGEKTYQPLSGVEFKLYQCGHECDLDCGNGCIHTHSGKPGAADSCWGDTPLRTTYSRANGLVEFNKLASGSYAFVETVTRTGYIALNDMWWVINVDATAQGGVSDPENAGSANPHISVVKGDDGSYALHNDRVLKQIDVRKKWLSENSLGAAYRPEKLVFDLYRNDELFIEGIEFDVNKTSTTIYYYIKDLYSYDSQGRSYTYKLVERTVPGYSSSISLSNKSSVRSEATVDNELQGILKISKQVEAGSRDKAFTFLLDLRANTTPVTSELCLEITAVDGTITDSIIHPDESGLYTVQIRHGETATVLNIPVGAEFSVTEKTEAGYTSVATGSSGTIQQSVEHTVAYINTYAATGSITFEGTKTLSGRALTEKDIFTFEVTENGTTNTWTVQNDTDGKIAYPTIEYIHNAEKSDLGKHTYTVKEVIPAEADKLPGVTCNPNKTEYTVTVTVTDNGDGTLKVVASDNAEALNFTNTYAATGSITFEGTKTIFGRALTEKDIFTFDVSENGTTNTWTVQNDKDGKIVYPTISYTLDDVGEHTYTVKETSTDGAGITVATNTYTVTVEVSDNGDGTLKVEPSENYTKLDFVNTYEAAGDITFEGTKTIFGRAMTDKDIFTFEVSDGEDTWTVENDNTGKIVYPTISYTLDDVGDHTYTVKETSTNGKGITVATNTYTVTVKVSDNGDGTLKVEPSDNYTELDFVNKYEATGSVTFEGTKTLTGRKMTDEDIFTFEVSDGEDTWTVSNDVTGKIVYPKISYTLDDVGEHTYTARETSTDGKGITVAKNTYTVTVTVTDKGDGTLDVVASDNAKMLDFVNTYKATGDVTFEGTKSIDGRAMTDKDIFTFEVSDGEDTWTVSNDATGKIVYPKISYTLDDVGEHTYTVKETSTDGRGITVAKNSYTVTVTVTDNGDGTLKIEPTENHTKLDFVNKYEAKGNVTFEGVKTISGRAMTDKDIFTFEVSDGEDTWNVSNDATGKITYPTIEYIHNAEKSDLGEHTYTVRETSTDGKGITVAKNSYTVTVTVTDKGDGTLDVVVSDNATALDFVNIYKATGEITFEGKKTIDGRDMTDKDIFTFEVKEGDKLVAEVKNDATGKIVYPKIKYTLDDVGEHTYTVKETSTDGAGITVATNTYTVTVEVSDNGDGTLKVEPSENYTKLDFVNTYEAAGDITFEGTKTISGRDMTEKDIFTFEVSGGIDTWTVQNDATGKIVYPKIKYTLDDVGEHTYTVKETSTDGAGITVATNTYTVTVEVSDNGDGTLKVEPSENYTKLDFVNTYEAAGDITFEGTKTISGRDMTEKDIFTFEVSGGIDTWTVQNDATGKIDYPKIKYTLDDVGEHTYTVKETSTDGKGITVAKNTYTVTVTVTDKGDGTLDVVASDNAKMLDFVNTYEAAGDITFEGTKTISGRKMTDEDIFSFSITERVAEGETGFTGTATNDATGKISYPKIEYTLDDVGTHTYTVKETSTDGRGITVATNTYTVTVNVSDNGDGTLNVAASDNAKALDFVNKYEAAGDITFEGTKIINGRNMTDEDIFTFEVSDGTDTWTVQNGTDGKIVYPTIEYIHNAEKSDLGEHTYTVRETSTDGKGITVATNTYTVTVKVSDNGDGTLKVEPSKNYTALDFENTYEATGDITFEGVKTIEGRKMTDKDIFTFEVSDGTTTWTVNSDTTGKIVYPMIEYTLADVGEHTYTVKETSKDGKGITVDVKTYEVKVNVSDNGDGTLNVVASDNAKVLDFINKYEATGEITFEGVKTIEGRKMTDKEIFTFEVSDGENSWTVENDKDGKIVYPKISYTLDDVGEHTYTVKETSTDGKGITVDTKTYEVKVTVSDNGDGTLKVEPSENYTKLDFVNTYEAAGDITFEGTKTISGRKMTDEDIFTFSITERVAEGETGFTGTATNDATGKIAYQKIGYTLEDVGTHTYTVKETSKDGAGIMVSEKAYTVTVEVSDNGDGTLNVVASDNATALDFTNVYEAKGSVTFEGTKTLTGRELATEEFSFQLLDKDGNVLETVKNDKDGKIAFTTLNYIHNAKESDLGDHTYTVKEVKGDLGGVTYDEMVYTIKVTVSDNGDGTLKVVATDNYKALNFTNTYEAKGKVDFTGVKTLEGRELKEGEFSFILLNKDGKEIETVKNDKDGKITFTTLNYTHNAKQSDLGEHTYTVKEVQADLEGVTYDEKVYTIKVTVTDNGDGTLKVVASDNAKALDFKNLYEADGTVLFTGTKVLAGREFRSSDVFLFELVENGVTIQRSRLTAASGTEAAFAFNPIQYTTEDIGTHTYLIREEKGSIKGVTYDAAEYTVTVTVADAGNGKLSVSKAYAVNGEAAEKVLFTNTYEATGELTLTAEKTVNGAEPTTDQVFSFTLSDEEGEIETVQNKFGEIAFSKLTYTLADLGEHSYTVKENKTDKAGYTIDETVYTVKVKVSDNGDGTLKVEKEITANGKTAESMTFDNKHSANLTLSKTVKGCTTDETFPVTVWLFDAKGNELKGEFAYTGDVSGKLTSGEAIQLGHGQMVTIELPVGTRYKVEETKDPRFATTVNSLAMNTADGEIVEGGNTAAFVNELITTEFTVWKEWRGGEGGKIRLTLYANGEKLDPQPEYTNNGNMYKYTELPKYDEDGDEIIYTAKEKYMDGYLTIYNNVSPYETVTDVIHNGGTIINKAVMDFKVQKVWSGVEEGAETPEITLILYCNGEVYEHATPKPDSEGWYHYRDLPTFVNGERAVYSVTEVPMEGCSTTYTNGGEEGDCAYNGGVITNIVVPKTGDETPVALWLTTMLLSAAALVLIGKKKNKA